MDSYWSKFRININYTLKQDRLIDTEPSIVIGINGKKREENKENPLAIQCLRLEGKDKLHSLQMYEQTEKTLCYEFENDIRLCFIKHGEDILYNLKTPKKCFTKKMDNILVNGFKKPHFASPEFDLLGDFIEQKTKP
jgi:hypothetical protein